MFETIKFDSPFIALEESYQKDLTKMILKGVLIDASENKNQWMVEETDFKNLAKDFLGKQIRCDHSEHISEVVGIVTGTEVDGPHSETKNDWDPPNNLSHIHYVAEISTKRDDLIVPLKSGYITHCSPAVDARTILCSKCRTPMIDKQHKGCDCQDGVMLLKDLSSRELSLVSSPAYEKTVAKVYSFAASVDKEINKIKGEDMVNEDRLTKLEASVSALIAAFKAAEEEQEEEEKKMKAEEELKAEEEEEAEKMVPVSKVAEEEEEEEEGKAEEEEEEEKVEKLEAEVQKLASLLEKSYSASKGKITPDTPEDEPAMTIHKIPKISNEPVKSDKPKPGAKSPFETPSQKPGKLKATAGKNKGESAGFTGARVSTKDSGEIEQLAVDEVFGFAASHGLTPLHIDYRVKTLRI